MLEEVRKIVHKLCDIEQPSNITNFSQLQVNNSNYVMNLNIHLEKAFEGVPDMVEEEEFIKSLRQKNDEEAKKKVAEETKDNSEVLNRITTFKKRFIKERSYNDPDTIFNVEFNDNVNQNSNTLVISLPIPPSRENTEFHPIREITDTRPMREMTERCPRIESQNHQYRQLNSNRERQRNFETSELRNITQQRSSQVSQDHGSRIQRSHELDEAFLTEERNIVSTTLEGHVQFQEDDLGDLSLEKANSMFSFA